MLVKESTDTLIMKLKGSQDHQKLPFGPCSPIWFLALLASDLVGSDRIRSFQFQMLQVVYIRTAALVRLVFFGRFANSCHYSITSCSWSGTSTSPAVHTWILPPYFFGKAAAKDQICCCLLFLIAQDTHWVTRPSSHAKFICREQFALHK